MPLVVTRPSLVALLIAGLGACASSSSISEDAPPGPGEDAPATPDGPDAPTAQAPRSGREIVAAAGRVRAGTVSMDVSIGHWVDQRAITAGTRTLVGATVVTP